MSTQTQATDGVGGIRNFLGNAASATFIILALLSIRFWWNTEPSDNNIRTKTSARVQCPAYNTDMTNSCVIGAEPIRLGVASSRYPMEKLQFCYTMELSELPNLTWKRVGTNMVEFRMLQGSATLWYRLLPLESRCPDTLT